MYPHVVRLHVCMSSVTLVHPAKVVGQNEMPFGRDTPVAPSISIRRALPSPMGMGDLESEPPVAAISHPPWTVNIFASIQQVSALCCSDVAHCQITLAVFKYCWNIIILVNGFLHFPASYPQILTPTFSTFLPFFRAFPTAVLVCAVQSVTVRPMWRQHKSSTNGYSVFLYLQFSVYLIDFANLLSCT